MTESRRICKRCDQILQINLFPRINPRLKAIRYAYTCKKCRTEKRREYYKVYYQKKKKESL